jgi:hypothetical protein
MKIFLAIYLTIGFLIALICHESNGKRVIKDPLMTAIVMCLWPYMVYFFLANRDKITIKKGDKVVWRGKKG